MKNLLVAASCLRKLRRDQLPRWNLLMKELGLSLTFFEFSQWLDIQFGIEVPLSLWEKEETDIILGWERGVIFAYCGGSLYPFSFSLLKDPPLIISFRGSFSGFLQPTLGVVGSREPRRESVQFMDQEFSDFLKKTRAVVVSGGARGIDQAAHSVAVRLGLPTIAVIPSGLENIYPHDFKDWEKLILNSGGAIMSEYSTFEPMRKQNFLERNRLIAALSQTVLIVEARRKSGTMITAHRAIEQNKSLMVVPGHPHDFHFSGSLDLLSEGATLVRDAQDLITFYQSECGIGFSNIHI
jgi:DNA processing protein